MKRIILVSVLILAFCIPLILSASQTQLDTDTFGGTAGTELHTYSANWDNATFGSQWFDLIISTPNGGAVGQNNQNGAMRTGQTWTNDQYAQATIAQLPDKKMFVCVRLGGVAGSPTSGYCVGPNPEAGGNAYVLYGIASFSIPLASSATSAATNDVVNLEVIGTTLTVRINGSVLSDLTTTDATYTTGSPGLYIGNEIAGKWSAWSAGSASSGGGGGATCQGALTLLGVGGC